MVSTRHHPRPFPPPPEPSSPPSTSRRNPETPTSTTSSSRTISDSPTQQAQSTIRSRSHSRKQNSTSASPKDEDKIESLTSTSKRAPTKQQLLRSTSTKQRASTTSSMYTHTPPPFLIPWLLISLPLVIWDTFYILLRPHTMPGGSIHYPIWSPYELYGRIDYIYGLPAWESQNGFTAAQGTMNALETICYLYYLFVIAKRVATGHGFIRGIALKSFNVFARRDGKQRDKIVVNGDADVAGAVVLVFVTLVLTSAKTVLYALNEYYSGWKHVRHNFEAPVRLIVLWVLPNSPWIFIPAIFGWIIGKEIVEAMCTAKGGRKQTAEGLRK